jgi:hypothetical protein
MNKNSTKADGMTKTNWQDYQIHEREMKHSRRYGLSPELEEVLIDHNPYLKRRVWRNIQKVHRESERSDRLSYTRRFSRHRIRHHHTAF